MAWYGSGEGMVGRALAAALLTLMPVDAAVAAATHAEKAAPRLMPLEVRVNQEQGGSWVLMEREGLLYAPEDALVAWRLRVPPELPRVSYRGQAWVALMNLPDFASRYDASSQSMDLNFSPSAFLASALQEDVPARPPLSPVESSLFLNYDISHTEQDFRDAPAIHDLGAVLEAGASGRFGVLTNSAMASNLIDDENLDPRRLRRLETTLTHDFPDSNLTLRLGDSSTRSNLGGRASYFGGIQFGRNYGLSPSFISQAIPVVAGVATAPSTVDLYVNNVLRQTSRVPTGPFTINDMPQINGAGEVRLVVRDLLGRESVLVQPFFASGQLLAEGLSDWGVEGGRLRRNLGLESADYGDSFAAASYRYGVSDARTLEGRVEALHDSAAAGVGISQMLWRSNLLQLGATGSQDKTVGGGLQWQAGLEHQSLQHVINLRVLGADADFRQLGASSPSERQRRQWLASYSYTPSTPSLGIVGLAWARVQDWAGSDVRTGSVNYSLRLGQWGSLAMTASRSRNESALLTANGRRTDTLFNLGLYLAPHRGSTIAASATLRGDQPGEGYVSYSRTSTDAEGWGGRLLAGRRLGQPYAEGGLYHESYAALLSADASVFEDQQTLRLGAQGGLVHIAGHSFATRRVDNGFALVDVPGYAGVGVGVHGRTLARTNDRGLAFIPGLNAYQANNVRLQAQDLPINAELDSLELVAVPAASSGVYLHFPVRTGRGALLRIVMADGKPAPAGARLRVKGDEEIFYVARRGEAFVTGLQDHAELMMQWEDGQCVLSVDLPPGKADEIPRVGPLRCDGVRP